MSICEALILGIVQGITEFLPVSSSGHLVLLQRIFGISEPVLIFDTALHGATLVAVIIVLWQDIWGILRRFFQPLTAYLLIATLPAVIAALFFKGFVEQAFTSGAFLGFGFLVTSALLFVSEGLYRRSTASADQPPGPGNGTCLRKLGEMNPLDALIIGLLQALAIAPGISRSGATISGALSRRLDRDFAARFCFLLSIPAILGALLLQVKDFMETGGEGAIGFSPLIAGTLTAFVVAFFSIKLALKIVRRHSLIGFSIYTGVLGLIVLMDKFVTQFFF